MFGDGGSYDNCCLYGKYLVSKCWKKLENDLGLDEGFTIFVADKLSVFCGLGKKLFLFLCIRGLVCVFPSIILTGCSISLLELTNAADLDSIRISEIKNK